MDDSILNEKLIVGNSWHGMNFKGVLLLRPYTSLSYDKMIIPWLSNIPVCPFKELERTLTVHSEYIRSRTPVL